MLTRVPVFLTSFTLLALFWWSHYAWSRRYGLDDGRSVLLSLILVGVVLVYVYPLRAIFESYLAYQSGGAIEAGFALTLDQLGTLFVVFGCGFSVLSTVIALVLPAALSPLSGYVYWTLMITMPLLSWLFGKRRRRVGVQQRAAPG